MKTHEAPPLSLRSSPAGWLASHRRLRWTLLSLAIFITLIALGYTVENWRGKRAWAQYKHDTEARGLSLDWNAYIPPPVPDDQNFFKAPNMQDWFTGRGMNKLGQRISLGNFQKELANHYANAEITVVPANARVAPESADLVLQYNPPLLSLADQNHPASVSETTSPPSIKKPTPHIQVQAAALKELQKWMQIKGDALGQPDPSLSLTDVMGVPVTRQTLSAIPPLRVVVRSDHALTANEIKEFFPATRLNNFVGSSDAVVTGSNTFRASIAFPSYIPAADYLRWSDSFKDDFAAIGEALKRPYARMEGDYEHPALIPFPNFVCIRMLGQTLALRAQSYLLLGEPEKALRELTLMNDLSRMMEARPTGKPMTLIAAMINVAVKGIYVGVIADGMRLHAWSAPQLATLQAQLTQTDLMPLMHDALHMGTVSFGRMVESSNSKELLEAYRGRETSLWQKLKDPVYDFVKFAPQGWIYQNAINGGVLQGVLLDSFDLTNHRVLPRNVDQQVRDADRAFKHLSPYNYIAIKYIPNFEHAMQTAARNQTLVNEARIVCALERYYLAYGRYPETLDALVPRFATTLPTDIIGGGPLKYYNQGAQFVLYSIGWNEKDDNGKPSYNDHLTGDLTQNDWTWPYQDKGER